MKTKDLIFHLSFKDFGMKSTSYLCLTNDSYIALNTRVATVREKYLENEIFSRSGKSQGILWMSREI